MECGRPVAGSSGRLVFQRAAAGRRRGLQAGERASSLDPLLRVLLVLVERADKPANKEPDDKQEQKIGEWFHEIGNAEALSL